MQNRAPTEAMSVVLRDKLYNNKILYLEGNAMQKKDLKRALVEQATCVVVLSNKLTTNPKEEDYKNIIHTFAVKNYCLQQGNRDIRVCLQLLKAEHKELFY